MKNLAKYFKKSIGKCFAISFVIAIANTSSASIGLTERAIDGSWMFIKVSDFLGRNDLNSPRTGSFVQVLRDQIVISPTCIVPIKYKTSNIKEVFDDLLVQRVQSSVIQNYLISSFNVNLVDKISRYDLSKSDCTKNIRHLLVQDKKMVAIASNGGLYLYHRDFSKESNQSSSRNLTEKITPFPFSPNNFSILCDQFINKINGVPQATAKCAPLYFPYVAKKDGATFLEKIIGHHNYVGTSPNLFYDYNDPFSYNLHPLYVVLPPLGNVTLVRVDDRDGNADDRDMFGGAYLSIKNGNVIDQLNDGCDMIAGHICVDDNGKEVSRLFGSGTFDRIKR